MKYWAIKKYSKVPVEKRPHPDFPVDYPESVIDLGYRNYYNNPDYVVMNNAEYIFYKKNADTLYWQFQENLEKNKRSYMAVEDYMKRVKAFSDKLISDFATENVFLGISQRGLTNHVRTSLSEVTNALLTYSLKDAVEELIKVDPEALDDVVLTPARLLSFRNKIEDFIGVPRGTEWNGPKTW